MKVLLDHCVPNQVGRMLADAGRDVVRLAECLPTDAPDPIVLSRAAELDAVLVSLNGDLPISWSIRRRATRESLRYK